MSAKNLKLQRIDKRQLFLDRNRKNYLEFDIEKTKTCLEIYEALNEKINNKIKEIYKNDSKKMKFSFIMICSKSINKWDSSSLIEIKVDLETSLSDIMMNKQYFLCYLPINSFNINKKRKFRNKFEEEENNNDRFKGVERKTIENHELEKYLYNEGIYYFDKEKVEFLYGKGNIDENKISINYKKTNIEILINEIKKDEFFENKIPPSIEVFKIKCPNYIFELHQNNVTHFLGLYKQKSYLIWRNAINKAKIKNNNSTIDSTFNTNIFDYNYLLFVKRHSIPCNCLLINQILENSEKRQIFLDEYKDKKISDIVNSIYSYKINIKKNNFFEAWMCLKQISFYVDFNNIEDEGQKRKEKEKYEHIFTQERIDIYNDTVKKVNTAIKKIKNYEEEMNNVLKNIFKYDLFDNLYYKIFELYIWPYFQKIKKILTTEYGYDKKPNTVKKFHLLLSKYCIHYFNMNNLDNFYCLCTSEDNKGENYNNTINNNKNIIDDAVNNHKNIIDDNPNNESNNNNFNDNKIITNKDIILNSEKEQNSDVKNKSN